MKRFVAYFPYRNSWGDRVNVVSEINECAKRENLTIITIAPNDYGIYVLFEKGGE